MKIEIKDDPYSSTLKQTEIKLEKVEISAYRKYSPSQDEPIKKTCKLYQP